MGVLPSRILPTVDAQQLWRRVYDPGLMPKHQALMWKIHLKAAPHGLLLSHILGHDSRCPRCGANNESIEHAYFSCPQIRPFWRRVEQTLTGSEASNRLDFTSAVDLSFRPRHGLTRATCLVPLAAAFWAIYRARIKQWKEQVGYNTDGLFAMWKHDITDILAAKRRTAIKHDSYRRFRTRWTWIAGCVRLFLPHQAMSPSG